MTNSPEYLTYQEAYYDLSQAISHPEQLGSLLWSKKFITPMEKSDSMDMSRRSYSRTTELLNVIARKIELQPEKLAELVTILKQHVSFQQLVTILNPTQAHSRPQSTSQSSQESREDTAELNEQEMKKWLTKRGLSKKDFELLVDEGFATGPAFMLLDEDDINEMKFTAGGKKLLKRLISSSSKVTPMDTTPSISATTATSTRVTTHTIPTTTSSLGDSVCTADVLCTELGLSPDVLDTEFLDNYSVFLAFGKLIPDWKIFAQDLQLSPQDIRGIETNISLTILMRTTETLKLWKRRFGFKAHYRALVDVALVHGEQTLAEQFCQILQNIIGGTPQDLDVAKPPGTTEPVTMELTVETLLVELEPLLFSKSNHGQLSRALSIPDARLSEFEANNISNIRQVRTEILKEWLRQSDTQSWCTIAFAVQKVGYKNLSSKLMTYRVPKEQAL